MARRKLTREEKMERLRTKFLAYLKKDYPTKRNLRAFNAAVTLHLKREAKYKARKKANKKRN